MNKYEAHLKVYQYRRLYTDTCKRREEKRVKEKRHITHLIVPCWTFSLDSTQQRDFAFISSFPSLWSDAVLLSLLSQSLFGLEWWRYVFLFHHQRDLGAQSLGWIPQKYCLILVFYKALVFGQACSGQRAEAWLKNIIIIQIP